MGNPPGFIHGYPGAQSGNVLVAGTRAEEQKVHQGNDAARNLRVPDLFGIFEFCGVWCRSPFASHSDETVDLMKIADNNVAVHSDFRFRRQPASGSHRHT
jgi:hypothetical protein